MSRAGILVLSLALWTACFGPEYPEGLPCSPAGACPYGQICYDHVCRGPAECWTAQDQDCDGDDVSVDCNDLDSTVGPSRAEVCGNQIDDDCDGVVDERVDQDADGVDHCFDCDDLDPNTAPGKPELCDGRDNNCNGAIDEGLCELCFRGEPDDDFNNSSSLAPANEHVLAICPFDDVDTFVFELFPNSGDMRITLHVFDGSDLQLNLYSQITFLESHVGSDIVISRSMADDNLLPPGPYYLEVFHANPLYSGSSFYILQLDVETVF